VLNRRVYRSREAAWIQLIVGIAFLIAVSLPALLASTSGPNNMSTLSRLGFIAVGLVGCGASLRCAWCSIRIESDGIRVVNPWKSRRLRWVEIAEFRLGRWGVLPRNCLIRLTDETTQGVWAISARNPNFFKHDSAAEGLVAELNERLRRSRSELTS
jgi:Bacterial PH domain